MAPMSLVTQPDPPAPAKPVMVLLEPEDRVSFDAERSELLSLLLPDEISSPQEYAAIAEDQGRVQAFVKRTKPSFDKVCDGAYRTWKDACGLRWLFYDGLEAFNARARTLLGNYDQRQERIRREEERRISEEERRKELDRQNREAKLLEKQGQREMAAAVRAQPVMAPAISLPSAVPEVKGLSFREDWKWRPVGGDSPEARAAAVKIVPREYLQLNDVALNSIARGMKGTVKVPGIEFYVVKVPVRK